MSLGSFAEDVLVGVIDSVRRHPLVSLMVLLSCIAGVALVWPHVPGMIDSAKIDMRKQIQDWAKGTRDEWTSCTGEASHWRDCKQHPRNVEYDLTCGPDGYCGAYCVPRSRYSNTGFTIKNCTEGMLVDVGRVSRINKKSTWTVETVRYKKNEYRRTLHQCASFRLEPRWIPYYASCYIHVTAS